MRIQEGHGMDEKVVGIIGGMGPEATVDLMARVIKATPASDDVDHIRMIVDNNPKVPSRIKALIEGTGESPVPCLQSMARKLADWGADFLAIPCNTAHFYHGDVQKEVTIPLLNMIDLATQHLKESCPGLETVGLLASTAVLNLGLYKKAFAQAGIRLLEPDADAQDRLMTAIRQVKTSTYGMEEVDNLQKAVDNLVAQGAQVLLVACTELSIIQSQIQPQVRLYDASQILAEAIVSTVKGQGEHYPFVHKESCLTDVTCRT